MGRVNCTPWIQRRFHFDFPIGLFPSIVERLRGTPARLEEMLRPLPPRILTTRAENKWSIQEHVGHLFDLEELHEGRISDFLSGAKVLRAADMENRKTNEADHNSKPIERILQQFRESRERFVGRLELLSEAEIALVSLHPRLGQPMRLVDMAYFVAEHDDHHLARIRELSRLLLASN